MQPLVKVLVVVGIVLLAVGVMKQWTKEGYGCMHKEGFRSWLQQEFEAVPPQPFVVPTLPLVVNAALTAPPQPSLVQQQLQESLPVAMLTPVMTQVGTSLPAVTPTMVPTFVPTVVPTSGAPSMITVQPSPMALTA